MATSHPGHEGRERLEPSAGDAPDTPVRHSRWSARAWSAAFWLCAALLLGGLGMYIARSLQSPLLGFLGADFVLLLLVAGYTSIKGSSSQERR